MKCRIKSKEGTPVRLYKINENQRKTDTSDKRKKYKQIEHGFTRKRLSNRREIIVIQTTNVHLIEPFLLSCLFFFCDTKFFINFGVISTEKKKEEKKKISEREESNEKK